MKKDVVSISSISYLWYWVCVMGFFKTGAILRIWWIEAIIATIIILIMHVTFRSWLYVGCRQEIAEIEVTPSVQYTCGFIGIVTAGFIYAAAILVLLAKLLFGIG